MFHTAYDKKKHGVMLRRALKTWESVSLLHQ